METELCLNLRVTDLTGKFDQIRPAGRKGDVETIGPSVR
jgi:hypothetical protein